MKKNVSIRKAVQFVVNAEKERYTMLGIGPMSENFLRASLEISKANLAVDMYSTVTRNCSVKR